LAKGKSERTKPNGLQKEEGYKGWRFRGTSLLPKKRIVNTVFPEMGRFDRNEKVRCGWALARRVEFLGLGPKAD